MIHKYLTYLSFCLIAVGFLSCSKEPPIDNQGEVVFKFDGIIDTGNVIFEAGENNYFLNTDYTDNGPNDVLLMKGEFLDKANFDDNFLRFEFYGYDSANNSGVVANVFNQTNYSSYSSDTAVQTIGGFTIRFGSVYGIGATINWDFGDGNFATGDTVVHSFSPNLIGSTVSMSSFYPAASCGDSVSNFIDLIDPVNNQVQFNLSTTLSLDSFSFDATPGFTNYSWDFGNQTSTQSATRFADVLYTDSTKKTIELVATKLLGTSTWKAVVTPNANPCFAAFVYDVIGSPITTTSTRLPYKTCIITYKKNGVIYSSYKNDNSDQSGRTAFNLNSALPYDNNPDGKRTVRLIGSVNTFLYNVNNANDSIPIVSGNVSIAVAHP